MIPTDWIATFQLSIFFRTALGKTLFAVLWRLGAGEDSKHIGFWAEPSVSLVSVGAFLFTEGFEREVNGLLALEAAFVEGVERTVEGLVKTEGAFVKGGDVAAGEEPRSISSIDVPIMVMCSASRDGISAGLLVSVLIDIGLVSVG